MYDFVRKITLSFKMKDQMNKFNCKQKQVLFQKQREAHSGKKYQRDDFIQQIQIRTIRT